MNLAKIFSMSAITLISLVGCAGNRIIHPLPQTPSMKVTVTNGVIYANDKPYAEIRCHFPTDDNENKNDFLTRGYDCRGLSIYYFTENIETWIFPKNGIPSKNIRNGKYTTASKTEFIVDSVYDINLSEDGKILRYKIPGIFWNTKKVFLLEQGISE